MVFADAGPWTFELEVMARLHEKEHASAGTFNQPKQSSLGESLMSSSAIDV